MNIYARLYLGILMLVSASLKGQNVGIGTNAPTKKLDVNGDELVGIVTPRYTGAMSFTLLGTTATFVQAFTWTGNEHLYVLFSLSSTVDWVKAQEFARFVKGHLPTVTSLAENNFIKSTILVNPMAQGHIPLGHTDARTEGTFECITGEIGIAGANTFADWDGGQPDNGYGTEDVAHYFATGFSPLRGWNDCRYFDQFFNAVIVEFEYTSCP